jgi:hypothetical protein
MQPKQLRINRVGFRFDVYAWYFTTQRLSVDLDGISSADNETLFYTLLFGAHDSYCKHSILKRNRYSFEKFKDKVDTFQYRNIKLLQAIIAESVASESDTELKKKPQNGMS